MENWIDAHILGDLPSLGLKLIAKSRIDGLPIYRVGSSNTTVSILYDENELEKYFKYEYIKGMEAITNIHSIEKSIVRKFSINNEVIKIIKFNKLMNKYL